jgi:transposase
MYVDISTVKHNGKSYTRYLLRQSYREQGKVKHRTLANLSSCSQEEIDAIRLALRHKHDLTHLGAVHEHIRLKQGLSIGALWLVYDMARQLGIVQALGATRAGKLALWQVLARVIDQGSRLSAVRLAGMHAVCDVLSLTKFNEDDLYENLDWLCQQQSVIEDRLATKRSHQEKLAVFFYDVTSSYLEGDQNELAAFGYNRDGKKGKPQIVIGLLCDVQGKPLSIELFAGNTQDPQTVAAQVRKVADRFGGGTVIFVGDRGMLKSQQIAELKQQGFDYITAITKPQIGSLLKSGVLDLELFHDEVREIITTDGLRYILRRNPIRVQELHKSREDKAQALEKAVSQQNHYLTEHPKAKVDVALRKLNAQCKQLKIAKWASVAAEDRVLSISVDAQAKAEDAQLDGCYVLKTELDQDQVGKAVIHERYKDLARVEWAFRSCKTTHLEMRPIYVRLEKRTRAHALVVMLAYHIIMELRARWQPLNLTVEEGIEELTHLCSMEVHVKGQSPYHEIPVPRDLSRQLLEAAQVRLPRVLPSQGIVVTTKKQLPPKRKSPSIQIG